MTQSGRCCSAGKFLASLLIALVVAAPVSLLQVMAPSPSMALTPSRDWKIADLVEVSRITDVSINEAAGSVAYIVRHGSLESGSDIFELRILNTEGTLKRVMRANFLADLSLRPHSNEWTFVADVGHGAQLYGIAGTGRVRSIVINPQTVMVGGYGLQINEYDVARKKGVLSYEWSPDGKRLWYSRVKLKSYRDQQFAYDQGVPYDDESMLGVTPRDVDREIRLQGVELRLFDLASKQDRLIASVDAKTGGDGDAFRRKNNNTYWVGPDDMQFTQRQVENGQLAYQLCRLSLSKRTTVCSAANNSALFYSVPSSRGYLQVEEAGAVHRLLERGLDGKLITDFGAVPFSGVGGTRGYWQNAKRSILAVGFEDRDGLAVVDHDRSAWRILDVPHFVGPCAFTQDLKWGVCSQESVTSPPRLVRVNVADGSTTILADPNLALRSIMPLTVKRETLSVDGYGDAVIYVTLPRGYQPGTRYPAVLVTHGWDAKDRFASRDLQWQYPIEVFAAQGFVVAAVNEPERRRGEPRAYSAGQRPGNSERLQAFEGPIPLATLKAAVDYLSKRGLADPKQIGVAGYSRGCSVVRYAISHSNLFRAASCGDSTWWDASGFWSGGKVGRSAYTNLFGGPPLEPGSYERYRAFSPTGNIANLRTPLLQQLAGGNAQSAMEMDQLLRFAGVPTELIVFPDESHLFALPRHRASAMQQNVDWFSFWLRGDEADASTNATQFTRWRKMRDEARRTGMVQ